MKTYARVQNGLVAEIIPPMQYDEDSPEGVVPAWKAGDEISIDRRYTPDLVAMMVDVTNLSPQPGENWSYNEGKFSPPSA